MVYIGHIKKNSEGIFETQDLVDHLKGTAVLAEKFSNEFNNSNWGRLLGLWHGNF